MKKTKDPEVLEEAEELKEYNPDSKEEQIKRAAELAAVPILEVAKLAASLKSSEDDALDGVIKAYWLLEAAYEGKRFLAEDVMQSRLTEIHISEFLEGLKGEDIDSDTFINLVWGIDRCRTLDNGNIVFADALKLLMPNGKKGGLNIQDRMSRLSRWLVEDLGAELEDVRKNLPLFCEEGISKENLRNFLKRFPKWWAQHLKDRHKKAGSLGGKATQSGKGRVRNKNSDKRLGSELGKKSSRKKKAP
jgi:hypothetical protein